MLLGKTSLPKSVNRGAWFRSSKSVFRLNLFFGFRLLDKTDDSAGFVDLGDAESGCLVLFHGQDSDSHIGLIVAMGLLQVPKIHAIKLVTAQDQHLASAIL